VAWRSSHDRPVGYGATGVDRASCATFRHSSTVRYADGRNRTIAIVFCGEIFWLTLIGVIHLQSATDKASLALVAVLMVIVAVRSGFSYVLILEPDVLRAKTLTRTRSWRYSELRSADRVCATSAYDRGCIILSPKVGKPYRFAIRSESPELPSFIDPLVGEINTRIVCAGLFPAIVRHSAGRHRE
jgi:hypothetical protein